ncbi:MAG: RNA-guided endonuclease TnpB family protein [Methanobacteriaceae archaeon]|nr:RNA-guided endonuclease TnpB family protein [Methanobacteriaceae archaeon]
MNKVIKSYKLRIYPNKRTQEAFIKNIGCCRFVYNECLNQHKKDQNKNVNSNFSYKYYDNILKDLKKNNEWLNEVDKYSLQSAYENLDNAFKRFHRGLSNYPKFKSKYNPVQSFKIKNKYSIYIQQNKIHLNQYGFVKFKDKRTIQGTILFAIISHKNNKWYVSVTCGYVPIKKLNKTSKNVGVDVGLNDFAILSNSEKIAKLKIDKMVNKCNRLQHRLSRKQKDSNNYKKTKLQLSKSYEKLTNYRNDFLHKLSIRLVNEFDIICIETLIIKNMLKDHKKANSISNVSWYNFFIMLEYKCNWYGKKLVKVNQFFPSSKKCNKCGYINRDLKLDMRNWTCPCCNETHDRDINAAINILNKGLSISTFGTKGI